MRALAAGAVIGIGVMLFTTACQSKPAGSDASSFTTGPNAKRYPLTGKVVSIDIAGRKATIAHGPVEGLMKGMTMAFDVKDEQALQSLKPGDQIRATLVVDEGNYFLENVEVDPSPGAPGS